jgi:hypothetical protein
VSPALKTTLLVLGSALGGIVVFVAAAGGYLYFKFFTLGPPAPGEFLPRPSIVHTPPPIKHDASFLGSHGVTMGGFSHDRGRMLAAGPGKLAGRITASGKPAQGLRLQLALNGEIFSQWGTSGADGRYEISVPYGKYRIDGYKLDSSSANAALAGRIDSPGNVHDSGVFEVAEGRVGKALELDFVEPVKKLGPQGEVSLEQPLVVTWAPYPGATEYRIQLVEQPTPGTPMAQKRLFDWNSQPKTAATAINLTERGVRLRKGYYYSYEIGALDSDGRELSNTPSSWRHPDFQAVE